MTTIHPDTRTLLRLPVLSLGRIRGALVLERTGRVEQTLERGRSHRATRLRLGRALDRADASPQLWSMSRAWIFSASVSSASSSPSGAMTSGSSSIPRARSLSASVRPSSSSMTTA